MDLVSKAKNSTGFSFKHTPGRKHWWQILQEENPEVAIAICKLVTAWRAGELPGFPSMRRLSMFMISELPEDVPPVSVNWVMQMSFWDEAARMETLERLEKACSKRRRSKRKKK